MQYFYINTDVLSLKKCPYSIWEKKSCAYLTPVLAKGFTPVPNKEPQPSQYRNTLTKLQIGDCLFAFRKLEGIVGVGLVKEKWDEEAYPCDPDIWSLNEPGPMYKIHVDWLPTIQSISSNEIIAAGLNTPMSALSPIIKNAKAAEKLFNSIAISKKLRQPEELSDSDVLFEGAKLQSLVNAYERNPRARNKCVEHYGAVCQVCEMSFSETYGAEFEGIIDVHHLVEISTIGEEYQVDPIKDLMPVCPNCHRMLHKRKPALSIVEAKKFFTKNK